MTGRLESIHVAEAAGTPMQSLRGAELVPGKGIVGDRYFAGLGECSPEVPEPDHELTLIEAEEIERFNADAGLGSEAGAFRRNLVTRGVRLNDLVGVEFSVGPVRVRGIRPCEPCAYLADLVHPKVLRRMLHRSGLRAGIVRGGRLRVGDAVETGAV